MEMELGNVEKGWVLKGAWGCVKTLPCKLKTKVIELAKSVKKVGQDDPRRVIHSMKVGLALTLVSLLYYLRSLYDGFGIAGMWAVLTVVVVFEFTVGGTLSKSLNRGFATLLAGASGVGAQQFARLFGQKGEPVVLGILVFVLAAAATFTRFFPRIKARYDYGVLIFILTFSMVSVSSYRVDELLVMAHQRLSTIVIGGATCMVISICVCPVWAGVELHKSVSSNVDKLANYLEGFERGYFQNRESGKQDMIKDTKDTSFLQGYKSVLNSKSAEESLANLARWEPRHGQFRFRHPWNQYLKIGALCRQCASQIEALNGYINSGDQAAQEFQITIEEPCRKMSEESSKALKLLASSIKSMTDPSNADIHVQNSQEAVEDLKVCLKALSLDHADLLAIVPAATVASILTEIVKIVEELYKSVNELSEKACFKSEKEAIATPEKPQLLHRGTINPVVDGDSCSEHVVITANEAR